MNRSHAVLVLVLAAFPLAFAISADAQRGRGRGHTKTKDAGAHAHIPSARSAGPGEVGHDAGGAVVDTPVRANPDGGVLEAKTLDGGTRVFRFRELDVEGRLTSPQIVYFLRRVRAEFAAGDLGHRSFMGELSETRKTSAF